MGKTKKGHKSTSSKCDGPEDLNAPPSKKAKETPVVGPEKCASSPEDEVFPKPETPAEEGEKCASGAEDIIQSPSKKAKEAPAVEVEKGASDPKVVSHLEVLPKAALTIDQLVETPAVEEDEKSVSDGSSGDGPVLDIADDVAPELEK